MPDWRGSPGRRVVPRPTRRLLRDGARARPLPQGHGPFRDRHQRRDDLLRRATGRDHRERVLVGLARSGPGHGRPRPAAVHHPDGPSARAATRSTCWRSDQQALSDCFAHAPVEPEPRGLLRRGLACLARPACRSSTAPSPRSSARRRDVQRRRPRPVHRPRGLARERPRGRRAAALLPPPLPAHRAGRGRARSKASRRAECRRSRRTGSTSATTFTARVRRSSSLHGATSLGAEDFAAQLPRCRRRSSSTCPMRAGTAGRAGTRPRASSTTGSSTTSLRSSTGWGSTRSISSASRWAR